MSITVDIMNDSYQRFVDSRQAQGHALDEIDGHVTAYRNSDRAKHTDSRGGPPLNAARAAPSSSINPRWTVLLGSWKPRLMVETGWRFGVS